MWMLIAGFLIFFMQAGFALVETGFTHAKNVAHTMMMNMMVFCIGAIGFWLVGFGLAFGGVNFTFPAVGGSAEWAFSPTTLGQWGDTLNVWLLRIDQIGILGGSGFMLNGLGAVSGILAFFIFQMVFMDTATTIPTGSMAERLKFGGFVLMGLWVSMFIYPVIANWVWGGGWLANLGRAAGLGNGAVDFAGSGVVHMVGGSLALVGAIVIGPRIGRFNKDGSANAMPGHNIPMGILGTIILFFGWFGLNPGSSLAFVGGGQFLAVNAAVNTLLAGAAGGIAAMAYMWLIGPSKKPDPGCVQPFGSPLDVITPRHSVDHPRHPVFARLPRRGTMNGVADAILRDRRISYLLVDRSLRIEEVHDPIGLWSDSDFALPGAPLLDVIPELIGCEETLNQLDLEPDSRMELDLVNRPGPDGVTAYWRMVALPRPHGLGEAGADFPGGGCERAGRAATALDAKL